MNNITGRSLTGVGSTGGGSVGNVNATLSNLNISNLNVNTIPNATINEFNINELVYTTISSINLGQIIANTTSAVINTFQVTTPNTVITINDTNWGSVSTLSSIVSYGLSSVAGQPTPGVSSLSTLLSYGLSTVARQPAPGVSSLSTMLSYGLSTVARQPAPGVSTLSSIVSYGLSTVAAQPAPGVSTLSSIVSYGLSSLVTSGQGLSSLSSIVSYGLSTVAAQPAPGVSTLSSIVSYGLSSLVTSGQGLSSLSSIVSYGLSSVAAGATNPGVSSLSSVMSYGLSSFNRTFATSSIFASNIITTQATISSLTVNGLIFGSGDGYVDFDAVRSVVISSVQENTGTLYAGGAYIGTVSTVNAVFFSGLSNTFDRTVITEISTATAGVQELLLYKGGGATDRIRLQTTGEIRLEANVTARTWPFNLQAAAPVLWAGAVGAGNGIGINTAAPAATLDIVDSAGVTTSLRAVYISTTQIYTSSIYSGAFLGDGGRLSNIGVGLSSLSSIVSYGLSSLVTSGQGLSSLSSIVSYGLSSVAAGATNPGVSSLSSVISYGLSSLMNGVVTMNGQLIINSNSSNPALTVNGTMSLIDTYYGTSNSFYVSSNLLYFNNNILYGSGQLQPQFITFS